MNGAEQLAVGTVVLVGGTIEAPIQPGNYSLRVVMHVQNLDGSFIQAFDPIQRTFSIAAGTTSIQTFAPLTITYALTRGQLSRDWEGFYSDANNAPHLAEFRFTSGGAWGFFDDGLQRASGVVTLVSWPVRAAPIFRLHPDLPNITLAFPTFASFLLRNGPPSFPIIQYLMQ